MNVFETFDLWKIPKILSGLACFGIRSAIVLFSIAVVYTGIRFLLSRGNPSEFTRTRKIFLEVLIGGVIVYGVYTMILTFASYFGVTSSSSVSMSCSFVIPNDPNNTNGPNPTLTPTPTLISAPTPTPTPVPTTTRTPVPTLIPTPTLIPPSGSPMRINSFNMVPNSVSFDTPTTVSFTLLISQLNPGFNCGGSNILYWVIWSSTPSGFGLPPVTSVYRTDSILLPLSTSPRDLSYSDTINMNEFTAFSNGGATFKATLGCTEFTLFSSEADFRNGLISSSPVFMSVNP